jgi:hypothetical protein
MRGVQRINSLINYRTERMKWTKGGCNGIMGLEEGCSRFIIDIIANF